jgi:hypothetical protein
MDRLWPIECDNSFIESLRLCNKFVINLKQAAV